MGIHKEVLKRAKARANSVSDQLSESSFLANRFTGNALEMDHLVTGELTEYGLKEMRLLLPPLIAMNSLLLKTLEDPRTANILYAAMEPLSAVLGKEPLPNSEVITKLRKDKNQWQDMLDLNNEKVTSPKSVHTIDQHGNIIEHI